MLRWVWCGALKPQRWSRSLLLIFMVYLLLPAPLKNRKSLLMKSNRHKNSTKPVLTEIIDSQQSHAYLCPSSGVDLRLAILVTSEPRNIIARGAIRKTWGHFAFRSDIAFAFVISTPPDNLTDAIEEEDMIYGDIIIGRLKDSYSNLTLKTLSMLKWVDTNCNRVPVMLKTNDDIFINVAKLIEFSNETLQRKAVKTIWGPIMQEYYPVRNTQSNHFTSQFQYPAVYLNYTTGKTYLITSDVIKDILFEAFHEPCLGNEDIFITGFLANKLGIERKDEPLFNIKRISSPHPCIVQRMISFPKMSYKFFFNLWRLMFNDTVDCDSLRLIWEPSLADVYEKK